MQYHRLLYVSVATKGLNQSVIDDILASSQLRNQRNAITGLLIYKSGYFLQLLEGPEQKVRETLGRIEKDTRHCKVEVIQEVDSDKRLFPGWSMAYAAETSFDKQWFEDLIRYCRKLQLDTEGTDENLWQQLVDLALDIHRSGQKKVSA